MIIIKCDKIEEQHNNVIKSSYYLQTEITDKIVREELENLFSWMKNYPPKLTAGGFLRLNRGILSTFVSTLVTYLIVIVQFASVQIKQ